MNDKIEFILRKPTKEDLDNYTPKPDDVIVEKITTRKVSDFPGGFSYEEKKECIIKSEHNRN